jgi:hypothetical protein
MGGKAQDGPHESRLGPARATTQGAAAHLSVSWHHRVDGAVNLPAEGHPDGQETVLVRKMIDCRKVPNEIGYAPTIAGSNEEILDAAVAHAVAKHSHQDTSEKFFLDRIAVEPGDGAQPTGDRGPGPAAGFQIAGEELDVRARRVRNRRS